MAEQSNSPKVQTPKAKPLKKKGKWFQKIPKNVLLSPAGAILVLFAIIMEAVDVIPIPFVDQLWEIPFHCVLFYKDKNLTTTYIHP